MAHTMSTTTRRAAIAALLAVVALAVIGLNRLESAPSPPTDQAIRSITPGPNEQIPQQGQVRVVLDAGFAGRLSIDQRDIPDDQISRSDEMVKTHEQLIFQPGPGKALEYFPPGQNCAKLTYWPISTGPEQSWVRTWCFTAV
jgi:hypothetical protein